MPHLALNIDMRKRTALIVGGGTVAARKLQALREAGARIRVVAPEVIPGIREQEASGAVTVRIGCYEAADLDGVALVVAATDDTAVNRRVAAEAGQKGLLVAVADQPEAGDCHFPAILRRGGLEIAVSTGGRCPALAAEVRDAIAGMIGHDYAGLVEELAAEREKLLTEGNGTTYNKKLLRAKARRLIAELSERKDIS
ncbi:MAG: bifunctional precorrin-2 dehydrogenase/sirohydrochlorin ferrochelatase [Oryzomonas sp.]|uniref:precorrin-2 dehydrogenase/sirohydrochlorin ferrochelatase family protein n=1 Tax=Oryzomonas sp. TaxID=2855186 RepID=UPI0028500E4C|nr:bifunctional precorrin-2 dehydrogenase/sirohydrochlorin ferrochelatase [Oryzomonas sp.]MDR3579787.1 bifunctional precorrin-2 dehydrogenase/sirohydrochlorin ferrochelatase [Oryzomonas sp.]